MNEQTNDFRIHTSGTFKGTPCIIFPSLIDPFFSCWRGERVLPTPAATQAPAPHRVRARILLVRERGQLLRANPRCRYHR